MEKMTHGKRGSSPCPSPATDSVEVDRTIWTIDAEYNDQEVHFYQGNPLIEPLPKILPTSDVAKRLTFLPPYSEEERKLESHVRYHLIANALDFHLPFSMTFELERMVSILIRKGYMGRNAVSPTYLKDFRERMNVPANGNASRPGPRSTANSTLVFGISGGGKSKAVEQILSLYPQVINHKRYKGERFPLSQIVWIKVDCPQDSSPRALCLQIIKEMDRLLGSNYVELYRAEDQTVDKLILTMRRLGSIHFLGGLFVDEVQNLVDAKVGIAPQLINFFVSLVNNICIPVVLIGTYRVIDVLSTRLRAIRRAEGQGSIMWRRMRQDGEWNRFVETMWMYQYTQNPSPILPNLGPALYDVSQGITDYAVKIFMLSQIRAIACRTEEINESIIRSVAWDSCYISRPVLLALKNGGDRVLKYVDDIEPIEFEKAFSRMVNPTYEIPNSTITSNTHRDNGKPDGGADLGSSAESPEASPRRARKLPKIPKGFEKKGLLPQSVAMGKEAGMAPYEVLRQSGFLRPLSEYVHRTD